MPCPRPEAPVLDALPTAWRRTRRDGLLPMKRAQECAVRRELDAAAATVLETLAGWRERLAAEPTISYRG